MKKLGCIPLRKGSKSIKNKNKRKMLGRPLFSWVLAEAIFSNLDEVIVFTDDVEIINIINHEYKWSNKVKAILRSAENAHDTASTEEALLEFCDKVNNNFDILCVLQATSPFTNRLDINKALNMVQNDTYDASLTVVNTSRFIWSKDGQPLNYEVLKRPRRQDFEGLLIENGAVYCTTKAAFHESKNRISKHIGLVEMIEESLYEIDVETDWLIVEKLLLNYLKKQKKADKITHLVLDVDGVFTDGKVSFSKDGEFSKAFDMRDGMGLEIIRSHDIKLYVITSEHSELVAKRMKKLNIEHVFLGIKDKHALLKHLINKEGMKWSHIAYIGDDINDMANLCSVGWSFVPKNAVADVKQIADVVLNHTSGSGAIREACHFIINYNTRF